MRHISGLLCAIALAALVYAALMFWSVAGVIAWTLWNAGNA